MLLQDSLPADFARRLQLFGGPEEQSDELALSPGLEFPNRLRLTFADGVSENTDKDTQNDHTINGKHDGK